MRVAAGYMGGHPAHTKSTEEGFLVASEVGVLYEWRTHDMKRLPMTSPQISAEDLLGTTLKGV